MLRPRESRDLRLISSEIKVTPEGALTWAEDVSATPLQGRQVSTLTLLKSFGSKKNDPKLLAHCSICLHPQPRGLMSASGGVDCAKGSLMRQVEGRVYYLGKTPFCD